MPDEIVAVAPEAQTPPAEPAEVKPEPKSSRARLEAVYEEHVVSEAGAVEPVAEEVVAEGAQAKPANPDGSEKPAAEASPSQPEKLAVTAEQLADTKYWGALDEDGWKRMERDYPVETKYVKSAQAAATRIVNTARKEAPKPPEEARHDDARPDDEPSAELIAAVEMTQSLDSKEAAKGHLLIAELTASAVLKKGGIDPNRAQAEATMAEAAAIATKILPELKKLNSDELDAAAEESPVLMALINTGNADNVALAMVEAGRVVIGRKSAKAAADKAAADKAAADAKKEATLKIVQSNAKPASATLLTPHGAAPDTRTARERLNAAADREIARQSAMGK